MQNLATLFTLNPSSGLPIYRQIILQIEQAVASGLLATDTELPSVRTLAAALQVNPMTVSKAYSQLERDAVLVRQRGIGMRVAVELPSGNLKVPSTSILKQTQILCRLALAEDYRTEQLVSLLQQQFQIQKSKEL